MIHIPVSTPSGNYEVQVGSGLIGKLEPALQAAGLRGRIAIVADATALALHGQKLPDALVIEVPPGEASKSLAQADRLWTTLLEAGIGRSDVLVSFGGGVVGDLAGFVAATLHRGMPFVQVPTTLLAQVDSSVGGKVAIDHPLGKNLVGAFHQPRLVLADVDTLSTLPARERWSGLAEVAKAALLGDLELLAMLERDLESLAAAPTGSMVGRAIQFKAKVVEQDERESGLRRILNFGHTVGHALEWVANEQHPGGTGRRPALPDAQPGDASLRGNAATPGMQGASRRGDAPAPLTHGEAVIYGMRAAIHISAREAGLPPADARRALALLARFPLPPLPALDREALFAAAWRDKKREGGAIHFVVLPALGAATTLRADPALLRSAIDAALESP